MEEFVMMDLAMKKEDRIYCGRYSIEDCITDNDKFDRRKFGRKEWPCGHKFNPFYVKSYSEGDWEWVWVGQDHKQPEAPAHVNCPKCKMKFSLIITVPQ